MISRTSFAVEDQVFIFDEEVYQSPYLSLLANTKIGKDIDNAGNLILDIDLILFENYVSYLQGKDFRMNKEDEEFFKFMGHTNIMQYPLDFWKITLREKWVRDNMYRLRLYEDPYFDLVEIPIKNTLFVEKWNGPYLEQPSYQVPTGVVIAGGAALWMATVRNMDAAESKKKYRGYTDIDMFFVCPKEQAEKILADELERLGFGNCGIGKNSITFDTDRQFILRLYKGPTEVVHGFDVDCCGILYDPITDKLWATKRAAYAIQHKINYINPERASPSYYYRLAKYKTRGYDIGIPLLKDEDVDLSSFKTQLADLLFTDGLEYVHQGGNAVAIDDEIDQILDADDNFRQYLDDSRCIRNFLEPLADEVNAMIHSKVTTFLEQSTINMAERLREETNNPVIDMIASHCSSPVSPEDIYRMTVHLDNLLSENNIHPWGTVINILRSAYWDWDNTYTRYLPCKAKDKVKDIVSKDPASIIILSKFLNLYTHLWKQSDYEPNTRVQKMRMKKFPAPLWMQEYRGITTIDLMRPIIESIVWKEQDPMTQITSTFHPEPITNIYEWLSQSPFYCG